MRPIKIFLGDLSYFNNNNKSGLYVPVNIGYLASYTKKLFGSDVEISLFKDPNKIAGCSYLFPPRYCRSVIL